jgi:Inner membrane component of T3SS, cytoplasmic domain/von Willebrand factor type A domain
LGATLRSLLSVRKIRGGFRRFGWGAVSAAVLLAPGAGSAAEGPAVTLALVIDTSGSLRRADLDQARELTLAVLAALPAGSEAAVFSFDDQSRLVQGRTADANAVRRAVDGLRTAGSHTALNDSLYDASRYLRDGPGRRRAILLVTDGRDEGSAVNLEDGLAVAQQAGIAVFCVGLGRVDERVLRRIAKLTGGQYRAGHEANPTEIAREMLQAPEAPAPAGTAEAAKASPPMAPPVAGAPPPARPAVSPVLWTGAGLLLLALAGALLLFATRKREVTATRPSSTEVPVSAGADDGAPPTMFARLDVSRETLPKTMLLREKPVLVVTAGARLGNVFPLSRGSTISVGRARANDIVLDDVAVSSQHCRIRPEDDRFVVHDLDSTNGTRVNDRQVKKHVLAEGDVIQIGETRLEFRMESTAAERI